LNASRAGSVLAWRSGRLGGVAWALPDRGSTGRSIRRGKGWWRGSRWEVTCNLWITRHGCTAPGKTALSREVAAILDRLGSSAISWQARLEKLRDGRLLGPILHEQPEATPKWPRTGLRRVPTWPDVATLEPEPSPNRSSNSESGGITEPLPEGTLVRGAGNLCAGRKHGGERRTGTVELIAAAVWDRPTTRCTQESSPSIDCLSSRWLDTPFSALGTDENSSPGRTD